MYKGKKIIGFIPARGGSKGIKNKNLFPLNGNPLIYYTLKSAAETPAIDEIVVSTNSNEIAEYCRSTEFPCTIINRPEEISTDTSKTIEAVVHTLDVFRANGKHFDYLLLLQPTSPLRQVFHIQQIIEKCIDTNKEAMLSVHEVINNPVLMRYSDNDFNLTKILNQNSTIRRQDMQKFYYVNGLLYIYKVDKLNLETSFNDIPYGYEVERKYAIDINNISDMQECEKLLNTIHLD